MGLLDNALQALKNQYQETKGNVGLLMSDPRQYMSGLNQDAAEYNRLSSLALQAERNAYRGIPVSQEQAAAKQYIDKQQEDMALAFVGNIKTVKPTAKFINEANQTASKNAEKMLGLPAGNTAMDRAKAMGFDTKTIRYHGSDQDINAFDPAKFGSKDQGFYGRGVTTDTDPEIASSYANYNEPISGQVVYPLLTRGKYFKWTEDTQPFASRKDSMQGTKDIQELGYQGTVMRNDRDLWGETPNFGEEQVTFNPANVRSRYAAFDPARANEADLLAGVVPLGLIAGKDQLELKKEKKPKK
jgi:hypothetical protein